MRFDRDPSPIDRRTFVKGAGASAAGVALFGGSAAAAEDYGNVVNIAEAGADASGSESINGVLQDYLESDTLLEFPNGRYVLDQQSFYGLQNFGMRAVGDDVTLVPADQYSDYWLAGSNVEDFLFEGFTIDETETGIHPEIGFNATDGLVVRDVTLEGYHDGSNQAFGFRITDPAGSGLLENVQLPDGGGNAVGIYTDTVGTLTVRDCHIEGFGDNGLYASRATGPVQVEGGTFKNNNISQVRLGSAESYVRNATVVVDDPPEHEAPRNARGVRVSDGPTEGRVTVESCDIVVRDAVGGGGVVSAYNGGAFTVSNTNIEVGRDYTSVDSGGERTSNAILADRQSAGSTTGCRVENSSITGEGVNLSAIWFRDRESTVVENTCIQQSGDSRSGIIYEECGDNSITNTTINVPEEAVVERDCTVSIGSISRTGSCPAPNLSGSDDETELTATTQSAEAESFDRTLVIDGTNGRTDATYEFEVSGSVRAASEGHAGVEGVDDVSGSSATGRVVGWTDVYEFSGELTGFSISGPADLVLDGESVSVDDLPSL